MWTTGVSGRSASSRSGRWTCWYANPCVRHPRISSVFFFFKDPAPTEIYPLPLHDALPIWRSEMRDRGSVKGERAERLLPQHALARADVDGGRGKHARSNRIGDHISRIADHLIHTHRDRKSTRLNSSHSQISYAVFCLKKKQ